MDGKGLIGIDDMQILLGSLPYRVVLKALLRKFLVVCEIITDPGSVSWFHPLDTPPGLPPLAELVDLGIY